MRKSVFITVIVLLSCFGVYGQISTNEEPVSFRTNIPALRVSENTQIVLPLLDMGKIRQEDKEDGIPPRFGYPYMRYAMCDTVLCLKVSHHTSRINENS